MAKKQSKKSKKQKSKSKVYFGLILSLVILVFLAYTLFDKMQEGNKVAALVNGEAITYLEIQMLYDQLPETYKAIITKNDILDQKINEKLLLQEALEKGIEVTDREVDEVVNSVIEQSGMTEKEFEARLSQQGINQAKLKEYYKTQLTILKLLNQTALSDMDVTEKEIRDYYDEAGIAQSGVSLNEAREQIQIVLLSQKREESFLTYIEEIKKESDIEVFLGIETFTDTGEEICRENNKPIIRLFTTSECESCKWIEDTFASTVSQYDLAAYHWELDTGDNKLTIKKETSTPKSEAEIFKKFSPSLKVPTFVFGCKYARVGAGYFEEDDLAGEKSEFDAVIKKLFVE